MTTLIDLKKRAGLTNEQIGRAIGCSASTAGKILHGSHCHVYSDASIQKLAEVLGVTFERCWFSMCESHNEQYGTPGVQHQRYSELQAQADKIMKQRHPELNIEVTVPRPLTIVDSVVVKPSPHFL